MSEHKTNQCNTVMGEPGRIINNLVRPAKNRTVRYRHAPEASIPQAFSKCFFLVSVTMFTKTNNASKQNYKFVSPIISQRLDFLSFSIAIGFLKGFLLKTKRYIKRVIYMKSFKYILEPSSSSELTVKIDSVKRSIGDHS